MRLYLDMLSRVSLRTGCTIIVIAHSKKMIEVGDDVRSSLRGSGALFDAAQGVLMLDGKKGKPTRVNHTKERIEGELRDTFGLVIEDVVGPIDGERKWGLQVRYLSSPELQEAYATDSGRVDNQLAINAERIASVGVRIGNLLAGAPDGLTMHTIKALLHTTASPAEINASMPMLIISGAAREEGAGSHKVYHYVDPNGV